MVFHWSTRQLLSLPLCAVPRLPHSLPVGYLHGHLHVPSKHSKLEESWSGGYMSPTVERMVCGSSPAAALMSFGMVLININQHQFLECLMTFHGRSAKARVIIMIAGASERTVLILMRLYPW